MGRATLVLLLAAACAAASASAAGFEGAAQSIALTSGEAGYKALTASSVAKAPADKRRGFRSGWQTSYLKGTATKPVQAVMLVYVYATAADARRAYARSCGGCGKDVMTQGVLM